MKKLIVTIIILSLSEPILAQVDSTMLNRLNKAIYSCDIIAFNSQRLISTFSTYQTDSITRVLTAWEQVCYENEPINRIKLLMAIQSGTVNDTLIAKYLYHYRYKYTNRVEENHMSGSYALYKEYYNYVPLKGDFDQWTARWANDMINQQSPTSSSYLVCLLLGNHLKEFDTFMSSKAYKKHPLVTMLRDLHYAHQGEYHPIGIKVGMWMPTGKLATGYKPSAFIGFELGGEITEQSRLDLFFDVAILQGDSPITLHVGLTGPVQTTAKAVLNLGVSYTRQFELRKNLGLDAIGALGYGRVDTDLKKPRKPDEEDSYYGAGTMDFSWGAMLRTKVGYRHQLGLRAMYHYAPYAAMSKILAKDIGNQYYTVALMYRF